MYLKTKLILNKNLIIIKYIKVIQLKIKSSVITIGTVERNDELVKYRARYYIYDLKDKYIWNNIIIYHKIAYFPTQL